ncbi:MAG: ABC transporter permease subunit [Lachnospiraceae bacterium]|nr:ABC transporter permease subunit [Lachnospiraceae bacterium]
MVIWKHEWKQNSKVWLIFCLAVGICCCGCVLMFDSVAESMEQMAESFAGMGSFATAFGMDKISIAKLEGFYAAEISLIFSLGGAMFAAMTGAALLSKEEEGHTAEFLHTLPLGRNRIVISKYVALVTLILAFNVIGILFEMTGIGIIGGEFAWKEYVLYHVLSLLMQLELGSVCFLVSACTKKKQIGMALGLSILLYLLDVMCRIVPDLEGAKYMTPFYYCNAADLFSKSGMEAGCIVIGLVVTAVSAVAAGVVYGKRDIAG